MFTRLESFSLVVVHRLLLPDDRRTIVGDLDYIRRSRCMHNDRPLLPAVQMEIPSPRRSADEPMILRCYTCSRASPAAK